MGDNIIDNVYLANVPFRITKDGNEFQEISLTTDLDVSAAKLQIFSYDDLFFLLTCNLSQIEVSTIVQISTISEIVSLISTLLRAALTRDVRLTASLTETPELLIDQMLRIPGVPAAGWTQIMKIPLQYGVGDVLRDHIVNLYSHQRARVNELETEIVAMRKKLDRKNVRR